MQKRLDILVLERGLAPSREGAQALILSGSVYTGEKRLEKPGTKYPNDIPLEIRSRTPKYVSRAGEKLEHALKTFNISVENKVCMDVGASTGGFTDCLLQRGAKHLFAIDVGYGQLDYKLRNDPRVTNLERTNARHLKQDDLVLLNPIAKEIQLVVSDVSFISYLKILRPLLNNFKTSQCGFIMLYKPQFELGREFILRGGVVKDESAIKNGLEEFQAECASMGLIKKDGPSLSPITGKKSGNSEYLLYYEANDA